MKYQRLLVLSLQLLSVIYFTVFDIYGQDAFTIRVDWKSPATDVSSNGLQFKLPNFDSITFSDGKLLRYHQEEVKSSISWQAVINSYVTSPALQEEIDYLNKNNIEVSESVFLDSKTTNGYGRRYFNVVFMPFLKVNGSIHRITELNCSRQTALSTYSYTKSYVTNSVLSSGTWYKIAVTSDGIFKIDKAFLNSIGINTSNLNSSHIHVYGNGDGRIPDLNSSPKRTDDLAQVAIQVVDGGDNRFDDTDYILFYAKGPNRWDYNGMDFVNERNVYSDISTYFICINSNVTQNRISTAAAVSTSITHSSNSYNYYAIVETDVYNYKECGQRWYGDLFDVELSRSYNFTFPNPVPAAPSKFRVIMGSDSPSNSFGSIEYRINNGFVASTSLPAGGSEAYGRKDTTINFSNSGALVLGITFNRNAASITGRLDKIELQSRRYIVASNGTVSFRDLQTVGVGYTTEFRVDGLGPNGFVWDVTNRQQPTIIPIQQEGSSHTFVAETNVLKEFVGSNGFSFPTPSFVEVIGNQNLHSLPVMDYLILTNAELMPQANRLAELHRSFYGYKVQVVDVKLIYNEFSSGAQDYAAIRHFIKMFYDRSQNSTGAKLKYVCMFGDGSFDPKGRVTGVKKNCVPTYEVNGSAYVESTQGNIGTDDYFAILDDNEGFGSVDIVDVAIGRILGSDLNTMRDQVNKIEHYMKNGSQFFTQNNINCVDGVSTSTFGDWRTKVTNVADFEDYFIVRDQEPAYELIKANHPDLNVKKLYLDAYQVVATVGGERFPQLNADLLQSFNTGSLIINYVGHGGVEKLSDATIINYSEIQALRNIDRLPLFVSSTCEFTRYDDPLNVSAGEWMSLNALGGAIGLLTTTRKVSYTLNTLVVNSLFREMFQRNAQMKALTLGEVLMKTKQRMGVTGSAGGAAFILVGDPALRLAMPEYKVVIDSINGRSVNVQVDTLTALSKVRVSAHIEDFYGNRLSTFNGVATTSLYDKVKQVQTLGQKPSTGTSTVGVANVLPYEEQKNVIYRGQSTVTNGDFKFEFIVPKDIDYSYGFGKFSLYVNGTQTDGLGEEQRVYVGGINPNGLDDKVGPLINLYLNSENFVNGGLTNETPFLIAKVRDESGINTVGNGIGHDITLILDGAVDKPIVLNDYYKNNIDSYKDGQIRFQLTDLKPGKHTLALKVWDVNNNSSEETLEFMVQEQQSLALKHVLNYPNPFTTHTEFFFEHNQCCVELEAMIQIFTVSGKLVKTILSPTYTVGYRSEGITWDGTDDYGDRLARGVYVYRLKVRTPDGETTEKLEKLVLL